MAHEKSTIAVFGSSWPAPGSPEYHEAQLLGRYLAENGFGIITGGYQGIMEAVSKGAHEAGGSVTGVTMSLFNPRRANPFVTNEIKVPDFFPRLRKLTDADGFIAVRGGIGTLTELSLTWSLLQTGVIKDKPFVLVGANWKRVLHIFQNELFIREADFRFVRLAEDAEQAVSCLKESFNTKE